MEIDNEVILEAISKDRAVRQAITRESHGMFFHIYFPHYVKYPMADFQKEIFKITEDRTNELACIVAFRGSAKSTLITLSYSLWSTLGNQQKKFVLIVAQTQAQARQHMTNIRHELENNKLLRSDLGPFQEESGNGDWAISSLVFKNTGARITIASTEQSIRGIRHQEHRPDLIILDDIEDLNSTKTFESREKIFGWFTREIIPLGDIGTRIIIVGNFLHDNALMIRLKTKIDDKELKGTFRWFPLIDKDGNCLWPGKFNTQEKIDELRQKVANESAWNQEYLLKIVHENTRVIHPEWIHYYDELPKDENFSHEYMGVDLAISQKESADYTAIVSVRLYGEEKDKKIFVLPNPVNKKLNYPETIATINEISRGGSFDKIPTIIVESNGFQEIYVDQLEKFGLPVVGIKSFSDKRLRLSMISEYIRNGTIYFPRKGNELLITQLTGFGDENHDDLSDALVMVITHIFKNPPKIINIRFIDSNEDSYFDEKLGITGANWKPFFR